MNSISSSSTINMLPKQNNFYNETMQDKTYSHEVNSNRQEKQQLSKMINGVNELLIPTHTSSKFVLHEKLNDYYVQVIDDKTKEVLREIPSKKFLDMYASMLDYVGLFLDKKI
ncbi:flagellar protein FlaG [Fictibacillus sp. KIGAM418]|uniref:Flagellar protein FlaG n=1 Tax=Fictibacillus marinisediminis TaxID=2878389 RepID=A0A9X1XJH7_9BACL|nr:flagellar protein FlaG [Fictibacillus marinisediminis]MCK6258674.1 flagellar protein FlaG [Fictibacillus marinisediminis]